MFTRCHGGWGGYLFSVIKLLLNPGVFIHLWDVRLKDLPRSLYYLNIASIMYGIVIMLLKTAILLEWARIFVPRGFRDIFWWTCHITIMINVLFYVSFTFIQIFPCVPRQRHWNPTIPGTCLDVAKVNIVAACINFVSDLGILLLPQIVIWSLSVSSSKKLAIGSMFAMGLFACLAAGFRLVNAATYVTSANILYRSSDMGLWCNVEMVCGFTIVCLPATGKLMKESPWIRKIISSF
ncbi:hypothetical protein P280DRAFT_538799, partial [Massarina eburnea CBS 473.64]